MSAPSSNGRACGKHMTAATETTIGSRVQEQPKDKMKAREAFDLAVNSGQPLPTIQALSEELLDKRTREGINRFSDRLDKQVLRSIPQVAGSDALESERKQMLKGTSFERIRKQMLKQVSDQVGGQLGGQVQKARREQQKRSRWPVEHLGGDYEA